MNTDFLLLGLRRRKRRHRGIRQNKTAFNSGAIQDVDLLICLTQHNPVCPYTPSRYR